MMTKLTSNLIAISIIFWCTTLAAEPTKDNYNVRLDHQSASTYFTVKPDFRKCVSPICGGWFVKPVNRKRIKCPDGSIRKQCYVSTDKISIPQLTKGQTDQLHQSMRESRVLIQGDLSNVIDYGLLIINNAWISATPQKPKGKFVSVSDNGIRCITFPCLSYDAQILNRQLQRTLADIDLSNVNADDGQLELAQAALQTKEGLPVAGDLFQVTGPAGSAPGITATQFYLKVTGEKPSQCMPTGCSGQICSDDNVITTCEWKPEYECFKTAQCTTQDDGDCGWEIDNELENCLANVRFNRILQQE